MRLELENNDGGHTIIPYEMAYGCAMRRMEKDGTSGIQCESFLCGKLKDLKLYELEAPMASSVTRTLEQVGSQDSVLRAMVPMLIRRIGADLILHANEMEVKNGSKK